MKNLFVTTAVLGLFALAPAAFAQDDHDHGGQAPAGHAGLAGGGGAPGGHAGPGGAPGGHAPMVSRPVQGAAGGLTHGPAVTAPTHNAVTQHDITPNRGGMTTAGPGGAGRDDRSHGAGAVAGGLKGGVRGPAANIGALRRNVQAARHFQAGAYRQPQGYVSRRWSFGQRLPGAYFARDYWITDYLAYSLFAPPPGEVWVRVGADALLIDQDTGEVIQADYGVFY